MVPWFIQIDTWNYPSHLFPCHLWFRAVGPEPITERLWNKLNVFLNYICIYKCVGVCAHVCVLCFWLPVLHHVCVHGDWTFAKFGCRSTAGLWSQHGCPHGNVCGNFIFLHPSVHQLGSKYLLWSHDLRHFGTPKVIWWWFDNYLPGSERAGGRV